MHCLDVQNKDTVYIFYMYFYLYLAFALDLSRRPRVNTNRGCNNRSSATSISIRSQILRSRAASNSVTFDLQTLVVVNSLVTYKKYLTHGVS